MRRDRQTGAHAHEPGVEPHLGDLRSAEIDLLQPSFVGLEIEGSGATVFNRKR